MAIKAGEVGKVITYYTGFDMSGHTEVNIYVTRPDGSELVVLDARISVPASPFVDATYGTFAASTYMQFTTLATDFPTAGGYHIYGEYKDATPKTFYGECACLTVEALTC